MESSGERPESAANTERRPISTWPTAGGDTRFPYTDICNPPMRLPSRADAFGAILEAATGATVEEPQGGNHSIRGDAGRARLWENFASSRKVERVRELLEVIDEIAAVRRSIPARPGALPVPGAEAFLLAAELVLPREPETVLERAQQTLQVPHELAVKIVTVLRRTDW